MRALAPAWPPKARASSTTTDRPSGSCVYGGGETCGPAAYDRRIIYLVASRTADHAKRTGEFGFAGIAKHGTIDGHHQRPIRRRGRIACDQFRGIVLPLRIEQMMWKAVAGQKTSQADDAAGIRGPNQYGAADASLDQVYPAQDQRAHDAFAEIGFGDQKRAQTFRRDQKRFDIAFSMAIDQRDAARELPDFGEELPRPLIDDGGDVTEAIALGDRNMPGQHDEHARSGLAGLEQFFAWLVGLDVAEPAHARDLWRRQHRKRLLVARERDSQRRAGS